MQREGCFCSYGFNNENVRPVGIFESTSAASGADVLLTTILTNHGFGGGKPEAQTDDGEPYDTSAFVAVRSTQGGGFFFAFGHRRLCRAVHTPPKPVVTRMRVRRHAGPSPEPPFGRSHGTATLAWAWTWKPSGAALVAALMRVVTASAPCGVRAGAAVMR